MIDTDVLGLQVYSGRAAPLQRLTQRKHGYDEDDGLRHSSERMAETLRQQLLDTSRGRIVTLLRAGGRTVEDLAKKLGLTSSAVRIQTAAMERDGVVKRVGKKPGTTRPSLVYELTPEIEQLLSKAYVPLLMHLVDAFAQALPAEQVETLLRTTGKGLAGELSRVCLAMESLVAEIIGVPVRECCDRDERPRCCFEVERTQPTLRR